MVELLPMGDLPLLEVWIPPTTHRPGDSFTGKVILNLDRPETVQLLKVDVEGGEAAFLQHLYLSQSHIIIGNEDETDKRGSRKADPSQSELLSQGRHAYEFRVELPADLPVSMRPSEYCGVLYYVKATLILHGKKPIKVHKNLPVSPSWNDFSICRIPNKTEADRSLHRTL